MVPGEENQLVPKEVRDRRAGLGPKPADRSEAHRPGAGGWQGRAPCGRLDGGRGGQLETAGSRGPCNWGRPQAARDEGIEDWTEGVPSRSGRGLGRESGLL